MSPSQVSVQDNGFQQTQVFTRFTEQLINHFTESGIPIPELSFDHKVLREPQEEQKEIKYKIKKLLDDFVKKSLNYITLQDIYKLTADNYDPLIKKFTAYVQSTKTDVNFKDNICLLARLCNIAEDDSQKHEVGISIILMINAICLDEFYKVPENFPKYITHANDLMLGFTDGDIPSSIDDPKTLERLIAREEIYFGSIARETINPDICFKHLERLSRILLLTETTEATEEIQERIHIKLNDYIEMILRNLSTVISRGLGCPEDDLESKKHELQESVIKTRNSILEVFKKNSTHLSALNCDDIIGTIGDMELAIFITKDDNYDIFSAAHATKSSSSPSLG